MSINNTPVSSQPFVIKGASHTKSNVVKIGGGAAAGAIIGGIAGGGKGAAIGAGVGAGAGTATAAVTGKKPASVESEAILQFFSSGSPAQAAEDSRSTDHRTERLRARRSTSHNEEDDDDQDDRQSGPRNDDRYSFSQSDHKVLNGCLSGYDFESLPPGIQKKLARGGTLPPGQAKKLHALPDACNARLPRLPHDLERIILGDRVLILQNGNRILDMLTFVR